MSVNALTAPTKQVPSVPPNQTLYIKNLDPRIKKEDLRLALYCLFGTYGAVLDVICTKANGMRGQAHVVFRDVVTATTAMRALQNFTFLEKEMHISYAKGKSDIIAKLDGTYRIPIPQQDSDLPQGMKPSGAEGVSDEESD